MSPIRNLIFDLDGTLIDSSRGVIEAVNYALVRNGLSEQPAERIRRYIGYPLEEMFADFTDHPYEVLHRDFQVRAAETIVVATEPLNGVEAVLGMFHREGYRMAIATTKIRRHVEGIVEKLGWGGYFVTFAGGDEVTRVKPEPDVLRLALERMGAEAGQTAFIGDTANDVLAAKAVPMISIAVASPYGRNGELLLAGPDYFVEAPGELPELIKRISKGRESG